MIKADKIISARWLVPIIPENTVLENHSLVIKNGTILDILPNDLALKQYQAPEIINKPRHVIMPGLINAHTHTPMVILRGIGDALPLKNWLEDCIWPAESALMSDEFIIQGTKLGIAEMLLNGITCFSEHYFKPELAANVVVETGMRALIGIGMHDQLPNNEANYQLAKILANMGSDTTNFAFAPHSPYMVSDESFRKILAVCEQTPMPIHIHLHETSNEVNNSLKQYGKRPIARLHDLGLFKQHLIAVHMVHINNLDLELLESNPCHIVTCPDSNLKLGSGICNINNFNALQLNVAVGTDGAASNNDLDLLAEAKNAALLNRSVNGNPLLSQASDVLSMLTINGARALGFEQKVGSLEIGKAADVIAIDNMQLIDKSKILEQLAFVKNCRNVSDVWVNGERLVSDSSLTKLELDEMLALAENWQARTAEFSVSDLVETQ